jgi:hypothetical protein
MTAIRLLFEDEWLEITAASADLRNYNENQ